MSETKKTLPELQQEYANLCAKAGEAQYKIASLKADVDEYHKQLRTVNLEAAALNAEAAKAAAPAAPEGAANV